MCVALCLAGISWSHAEEFLPDSPLYAYAAANTACPGPEEDTTQGNRVCVVNDGYDALTLRVHLIRAARRSIDIQTFILENDECGRLLIYELIQAAKRGVHVRILADHFMSAQDNDWVAFLSSAHPNLELKYYRPPGGLISPSGPRTLLHSILFFRGYNQRMHNKILLVDDMIAVTGGRNIDNHYYNHSLSYNFIDRDAMVVGPTVPAVVASFAAYWDYRKSVPSGELRDVARVVRRDCFDKPETWEEFDFHGFFEDVVRDAGDADYVREHFVERFMKAKKLEFLVDDPGKNKGLTLWGSGRVTRRLRKVMKGTEQELLIQSPYLILNGTARRSFRRLRKRAPEALIFVSTNSFAATDNTIAYSANYKLRSVYIERLGFHIYEYKPHPGDLTALLPNYADLEGRAREKGLRDPFLCIHAKSFVRDERIAYIGSYNIDPRSDNLNSEVGVLIEDECIARALKEEILRATRPENSWVIAEREFPLADVNYLIEGLSGITPIDIWPLRNTSSFELKEGMEPVPPGDKDFYKRYEPVGSFPGAEGVSTKEVATYLYKMLNTLAIPVL